MEWLIGKSDPVFWKEYTDTFSGTQSKTDDGARFVVFDCQKTGLDWKNDSILSIGCVGIINNELIVNDYLELYIDQRGNTTTTVHINPTISGQVVRYTELEAISKFLEYIKNAYLVGLNTNLDIEMINQVLKRNGLGKLKNIILDVNVMHNLKKKISYDSNSSLEELCDMYNLTKNHRQNTSGNAYLIGLLFLKLAKHVKLDY